MKQKLIDNFSLEGSTPKPVGWILYGPYKYVSWIETRFCETLNYSNLLLLILQLILIYLFKMDGYTAFIILYIRKKISISARILATYETTVFPCYIVKTLCINHGSWFMFTWSRNILISSCFVYCKNSKDWTKMLYHHNFRAPANWTDEFMLFF